MEDGALQIKHTEHKLNLDLKKINIEHNFWAINKKCYTFKIKHSTLNSKY